MTDEEFTSRRRRGRLMLVGVAVVFLGPLVAAFLLYFGSGWSPKGSAEHGVLILPARPMPDIALSSEDATVRLRDRWTLLIVEPAACDEHCREALYETRQLRRALGKEMDRVQRVWISTGGQADSGFVGSEHPDLVVVDGARPVVAKLIAVIGSHTAGEIFLVDPHGNLMMRFPPGTGMRAIHTDLKRLLKVSRIG